VNQQESAQAGMAYQLGAADANAYDLAEPYPDRIAERVATALHFTDVTTVSVDIVNRAYRDGYNKAIQVQEAAESEHTSSASTSEVTVPDEGSTELVTVAIHWEPMSGWWRQSLVIPTGSTHPTVIVFDLGASTPWQTDDRSLAVYDMAERLAYPLVYLGPISADALDDFAPFDEPCPDVPFVKAGDGQSSGQFAIMLDGRWELFEDATAHIDPRNGSSS
jgi:hypothetical protein